MRKKLFIGLVFVIFSMALVTNSVFSASRGNQINIETIYMVGSAGSTSEQTSFDLDGTPWLYFQMPTYSGNNPITTELWWNAPDYSQYYVTDSSTTEHVWYELTNWTDVKAYGEWIVDAKYTDGANWWGNGAASFTVTPEPVSAILFLSGGATLALRRYWKKRKS